MSKIDQLERLVELLKQGLLTESEFNDAKSALISSQDSDVSILQNESISTGTPEPTPEPIPAPSSSSITDEPVISVSSEEKYDNYGRLVKPEFDQYGRMNNDSNSPPINFPIIAVGVTVMAGLFAFITIFVGLILNSPSTSPESGQNNNILENSR